MSYKLSRSRPLSNEAVRIGAELNSHGVAITSAESLLQTHENYGELLGAVEEMELNRKEQLAAARKESEKKDAIGEKVFNLEMLGRQPVFDISNTYAHFALQKEILGIANAYLGMFTSLRYFNVWHTFATNGGPRESQLWHRDREDFRILKLFLYLSDVDENSGSFNYVPGTHRKGKYRSLEPEHFLEGGVRRSTDEQMQAAIPEDRWKKCTGKKGTLIFADTSGYHKGGEARTKDRLMYTCMYTSPASESERLIKFPDDFDPSLLDKEQSRALQI